MTADQLADAARGAGFRDARVSRKLHHPLLRLGDAQTVARDRSGSQLALLSGGERREGLRRIEEEVAARGEDGWDGFVRS